MGCKGAWVIVWLAAVSAAAPCDAAREEDGGRASVAQRLQAVKQRIRAHEATLPKELRAGPGRLAEAKLALRKATDALRSRYGGWSVESALGDAERAAEALGKRPKNGGPRVGFQERAYVSEIDGSAEPYLLYVPKGYHEAREWPLLVFLHGYHPYLRPDNWIGFMYSPTLEEVCEREGVILLMPFGRSNTEFMGIGESDVLRTIGYVRDEYRVDRRRVFISGASMGGSGAYSIACHYPDMFAGMAGITGRVDYYLWMGVKRESLPRFKQVQVDTDYALEILPNLSHVPVLIFHGELDYVLPVRQSRLFDRLLRELGQPHEYAEFGNAGHYGVWSKSFRHPSFGRMLGSAQAKERPAKFTFRTFTLKYSSAYWMTIDEIVHWGKVAEVHAEVPRAGVISLRCENVAALTLTPRVPNVPEPASARISVNGRKVKGKAAPDGGIRLRLRPVIEGTGPRKTPRLCGPIREAYDGPFVIVYPGVSSPKTAQDRLNAKRLAQEWIAFAQGTPMLRSDTQVSEEDIRERNLIVCGSPETNAVLRRMARGLPVRIERKEYVIGPHRFPREGNGVQVIYPNPLNPERYALVVHGVQWGAELQPNHKLDFLPDFIVYAADTVQDGTMFPTNRVLCAGYFDGRWALSEQSTWVKSGGIPMKATPAPADAEAGAER